MSGCRYHIHLRNIFIIAIIVYVAFVFINQQNTLNDYNKDTEKLNQQIASEEATNENLNEQKENVNSLEFIEEMAREKLDMYYPNERVYMDQGM